jgi:hypothetical protein
MPLLRGLCTVAAVAAVMMLGVDAEAQSGKKTSLCKGLDEKACRAKTAECGWISPKKGKQRPYCRQKTVRKAR